MFRQITREIEYILYILKMFLSSNNLYTDMHMYICVYVNSKIDRLLITLLLFLNFRQYDSWRQIQQCIHKTLQL